MVKRFFLVIGLSLPVFAASLQGIVVDEKDHKSVNGARVVVFHDLSSIAVQQATTDRKGNYYFTLAPGPYRVIVIKSGFEILRDRTLIVHERDKVSLQHALSLVGSVAQSKNEKKLKDILRNGSNEPFDLQAGPTGIALSLAPRKQESLIASMRTRTRQGQGGELDLVSTVNVDARVSDGIHILSSLSNGRSGIMETRSMQIRAGVAMKINESSFDISAESIQDPENDDSSYSKVLKVGGTYGSDIQSGTRLSLTQSMGEAQNQKKMALEQDVRYEIREHQLNHETRVTGWDRNGDVYAHQASFRTDWKHGPNARIGLSTDLGYLDLPSEQRMSSKLWVTGDQLRVNDRIAVSSRVGVSYLSNDDEIVQQHLVSAALGPVAFQATYANDFNDKPFTAHDLFGNYLVQPLTPYSNQGFYRNHSQQVGFETSINHGSGWDSQICWNRTEARADLLFQQDEMKFKPQASQEVNRFGYTLRATSLGASLALSHSLNNDDRTAFASSELTYGQVVTPFHKKGLGFQFELRMKNNATIPAWWLLEEGPWLTGESGLFYEGQLSLQF